MSEPNFTALGRAAFIGYFLAMQIGIDSFVATRKHPVTGVSPSPAERIRDLLEEIEQADRSGVDAFGAGRRGQVLSISVAARGTRRGERANWAAATLPEANYAGQESLLPGSARLLS